MINGNKNIKSQINYFKGRKEYLNILSFLGYYKMKRIMKNKLRLQRHLKLIRKYEAPTFCLKHSMKMFTENLNIFELYFLSFDR